MIVVRIRGAFALSILLIGLGLITGFYIGAGEMSKEAFKEGFQEAQSWREAQQRCVRENQRLHTFLDPIFGKIQIDTE